VNPLLAVLLTLFFSLSGPAMGGCSDFGRSSIAANTAGRGPVIVGETMSRVTEAARGVPGAKILNDMPTFTGTADQVTSSMMQYNRTWILDQ
jgi:hypothetical protein